MDARNDGKKEAANQIHFMPIGTVIGLTNKGLIVQKKYVRYKEGAKLFSVSQNMFELWAKEAGAVIKKEKIALVDLEVLDAYLQTFRTPPEYWGLL